MTRQEMFDKAYLGLASQGFEQSMEVVDGVEIDCAYRGDDGRKCAIGWLIPDDWYSENLEGKKAGHEDVRSAAGVDEGDIDFAYDLQKLHDVAQGPEDMEAGFRIFAGIHGLTIPQVPV